MNHGIEFEIQNGLKKLNKKQLKLILKTDFKMK